MSPSYFCRNLVYQFIESKGCFISPSPPPKKKSFLFLLFCYVLLCVHSSFCNHLEEEEKAGCFAIIIVHMYCYYKCSVALLHGAVKLCTSLQCLIVVFPDHTWLLFHVD